MSDPGQQVLTFAADPVWHGLNANDPTDEKSILLGHAKNKGWDAKTASEAAYQAIKAHREAEQRLGIPADQVFKWPKDKTDEAGWKSVYSKLGVPEAAEKYDFTGIELTDKELEADIRKTAKELNLTQEQASALAKREADRVKVDVLRDEEKRLAAIAAGRDALAKDWGPNAESNKFIARQAATKLGLDAEFVQNLENQLGYAKTKNTFLALGKMMGEDKFVANQNAADPGVLTATQASARLDDLKRDPNWVNRVNTGDHKANEELTALNRIIALGAGA